MLLVHFTIITKIKILNKNIFSLKVLIVELVRSSTWRLVNGPPTIRYMPVPHPADGLPLMFREMPVDLRRRAFTMGW